MSSEAIKLKPDMVEKRYEYRLPRPLDYPISCTTKKENEDITFEVINYHYKGACLKINSDIHFDIKNISVINFYLGGECIKDDIRIRVVWEKIKTEKTFGVEFIEEQSRHLRKFERILCHQNFSPTVYAKDPLDPHRDIYFQTLDVSLNGMLLKSSLVNRHLLPGMKVAQAKITFPGNDPIAVDLLITNTKRSEDKEGFCLGVSLKNNIDQYQKLVQPYVMTLSPIKTPDADRIETLTQHGFNTKNLKQGLTYREIKTQKEYEDVLKLRMIGYGKHGKVSHHATWKDQGEGLEHEGLIIAGYMGSQIISSMELRFGDEHHVFRFDKYFDLRGNPSFQPKQTVEINKLVIHPKIQGSNIVIGMFQRAHAILLAKGKYDVIILATDTLAPLYQKIGFTKFGASVPHPVIKNEMLNLMMLRKESYTEGKFLNPTVWNYIFETTYAHLGSLGVHQYKKEKTTPHITQEKQKFLDPSLTSQHITVSVIKPYLYVAEQMIGQDKVKLILQKIGIPHEHLANSSNWISVKFLDSFLHHFSAFGNISDLSYKAGIELVTPHMMGFNYFILKNFLSPELAFPQFPKMIGKFNRTRTCTVHEAKAGRVKIDIGLTASKILPEHDVSCLNWKACFKAYILVMTGQEPTVEKTKCCYKGDSACSYTITWQPKTKLASFLIEKLIHLFDSKKHLRKEIEILSSNFEKFEHESHERYIELQNAKEKLDMRYRESHLLEKTSKLIQEASGLQEIVDTALKSICSDFGLDRTFLMLINDQKTELSTFSLHARQPEFIDKGKSLLYAYKVDVSKKRENPAVISSVFLSGNPILIDRVEDHLFQFNDASKTLIQNLKTSSFIMVPVQGKNNIWGVLIADRISSDVRLNYSDLVLISRVSQHLGLALDKFAQLDHEKKMQSIFKKYVPLGLNISDKNEITNSIGGQMQWITCSFIDIRGFTKLSTKHSPQKILSILNHIFSAIQKTASQLGGTIDKFMGDGAMVVWGYQKTSTHYEENAVLFALALQKEIAIISEQIFQEAQETLAIGIGINSGNAIVGNIGNEERMEYTAIGSAVNLASRLESLTKELQTHLIVSESVYEKLSSSLQNNFKLILNQNIRGLSESIKIAIYKNEDYRK